MSSSKKEKDEESEREKKRKLFASPSHLTLFTAPSQNQYQPLRETFPFSKRAKELWRESSFVIGLLKLLFLPDLIVSLRSRYHLNSSTISLGCQHELWADIARDFSKKKDFFHAESKYKKLRRLLLLISLA
jgi:hypothetical protein